jgi:hypothetical protein
MSITLQSNMITFKQFISEGGAATSDWGVSRANASDIQEALKFVSKVISVPYDELAQDLLGSTKLTLAGKRKDSGDIDIAFSVDKDDPEHIDSLMMKAVNGEGHYNKGTRVGSYAVPANGKKIQVDLMYVTNKDWAKFSYHSSQGDGSAYPGAVRNSLIRHALANRMVPDEDFVLKDESGNTIAKAQRAIKMDHGMERLFKVAKQTKNGLSKTLEKTDAEGVKKFLQQIGKSVKFKADAELVTDPVKAVQFIFGAGVQPQDVKTAEQVIALIKKKFPNHSKIFADVRKELEKMDMPVPKELS